jgi:ABC-type bacteriocin/lantibiotic exporter with double-glycine peptidase domain
LRVARTGALAVALIVAAGCAPSLGRPFAPSRFEREGGWTAVRGVPLVLQRRQLDCGAAAAAMVLGYWRLPATADELRAASKIPEDRGLPAGWLRDELRVRGLESYLIEGTFEDLAHELAAGRPVLVGIVRERIAHYQVVIGLDKEHRRVVVVDPVAGWLEVPRETFEAGWVHAKRLALVAFPPAPAS